jgi:hypothetical protein
MADAFPISGNIDPKSFPFLLTDLHRHGATGSLKVEGPTYQKALYFRSGRILFGSSNDPRDQLGAILIENGKITSEQLDEVNTKVGPGRPLAKVLSESGIVNQQELSEAAQIKVERILWDIITYQSGAFEFEDGVLPKGAVDLKLSTERLILASVRRIQDPGFVARHLGDEDVVLRPTNELSARLHEVQSDAGGLAEQLDGTRTLRQAAAVARLDPFEAAKVACGLLILGLVERTGDAVVVEPTVEDEGTIDLADTARSSLEGDAGETPFFVPEGMEAPAKSPALVPTAVALEAEPEPEPEIVAPQVLPPEPEPELAPTIAMPPRAPEPALPVDFFTPATPRPATDRDAGSRSSPSLPLIPPPARNEPIRPVPPPTEVVSLPDEISAPPTPAAPPSKEDLAALDALLNPRRSGSQVSRERLDKDASNWEPRFTALSGGARRAPSSGPNMKALLGVAALVIVAGGGGAAWWFYVYQPSQVKSAVNPPPVARPAVPARVIATATTGIPTATAVTTSVPTSAPTAVETPVHHVTAPPPPPKTPPPADTGAAAAGLGAARNLMQAGRYRDAAQAFSGHIQHAAAQHFTVQLLVACSDDTVRKAVESVPSGELFITPADYKGRSCYRMGWGLYEDEGRAAQAMRSLPSYFHQPGVAPRVVPASAFLH